MKWHLVRQTNNREYVSETVEGTQQEAKSKAEIENMGSDTYTVIARPALPTSKPTRQ